VDPLATLSLSESLSPPESEEECDGLRERLLFLPSLAARFPLNLLCFSLMGRKLRFAAALAFLTAWSSLSFEGKPAGELLDALS
jgi:hypothetical protein